jgi:PPK2 family polyphosphate:nucleotide phosphotransferase
MLSRPQAALSVSSDMARKSFKPKPNDLAAEAHRIVPGESVRLSEISTKSPIPAGEREAAENEFSKLRDELIESQNRLYAESKQKLLIVLQAIDGGGKDGTIRHCFKGVNPQGVQVTSFKAPTSHELARDYLWRIHAAVPPKGMIGVFNRSHYEDVLIVRVDKLVPAEVWEKRYEHINSFEKLLADEGTRILKFLLHISQAEQHERFEKRLADVTKQYKYSAEDREKSKLWDEYMLAFEDMLTKCSTTWAPWHVIPADQKWYRDLAVMRAMIATLREMNPQYPPPKLH